MYSSDEVQRKRLRVSQSNIKSSLNYLQANTAVQSHVERKSSEL